MTNIEDDINIATASVEKLLTETEKLPELIKEFSGFHPNISEWFTNLIERSADDVSRIIAAVKAHLSFLNYPVGESVPSPTPTAVVPEAVAPAVSVPESTAIVAEPSLETTPTA